MIPFTVNRVQTYIVKHIIHPAHVPLIVEAHAAHVDWLGNKRPGSGFLSNHECFRMELENGLIELFDEIHCLQITRVAIFVWLPLAVLAAIVQIKHIGNCIDAQPINMILFKPEHRIGNQEALHLCTSIIEIRRTPFPVLCTLFII